MKGGQDETRRKKKLVVEAPQNEILCAETCKRAVLP